MSSFLTQSSHMHQPRFLARCLPPRHPHHCRLQSHSRFASCFRTTSPCLLLGRTIHRCSLRALRTPSRVRPLRRSTVMWCRLCYGSRIFRSRLLHPRIIRFRWLQPRHPRRRPRDARPGRDYPLPHVLRRARFFDRSYVDLRQNGTPPARVHSYHRGGSVLGLVLPSASQAAAG